VRRFFASGSDWVAEAWKENHPIPGADELCLHQLYRAMRWLGEKIGQEALGSPYAPMN
jgi:hypothetical protein